MTPRLENSHTVGMISGNLVDLLNPTPEAFSWHDVAHALAHICRFNGNVNRFYSVAQHSCMVHDLLPASERYLRLQGLLHDAHEAFIGDLTTPLKVALARALGDESRDLFESFECAHKRAITLKAGLAWPWPWDREVAIKRADRTALATEVRDLRPTIAGYDPGPAAGPSIAPLGPEAAAEEFLSRLALYGIEAGAGRAAPRTSDLLDFLGDCVEHAPNRSVAVNIVFQQYQVWCRCRGIEALSLAVFTEGMVKWGVHVEGGRTFPGRFLSVRLIEGHAADQADIWDSRS